MLVPTKSDQLIALLHAQQSEARLLSIEIRGSGPWTASSARLDDLNDRIMHLGALEPTPADDGPHAATPPGSVDPAA